MVLFGMTVVPSCETYLGTGSGPCVGMVCKQCIHSQKKIWMIAATVQIIIEHHPKRGYFMDPKKLPLIFKDSMSEEDLAMLGEFSFCRLDRERYVGGVIRS